MKQILHISKTHREAVSNFHDWRYRRRWDTAVQHGPVMYMSRDGFMHWFGSEERHESLKGCVLDKVVIYGDISKEMINSVLRPALLSTNGKVEYVV